MKQKGDMIKETTFGELRICEYYDEFEKPKIILPDILLRGNFALDIKGGIYCNEYKGKNRTT